MSYVIKICVVISWTGLCADVKRCRHFVGLLCIALDEKEIHGKKSVYVVKVRKTWHKI